MLADVVAADEFFPTEITSARVTLIPKPPKFLKRTSEKSVSKTSIDEESANFSGATNYLQKLGEGECGTVYMAEQRRARLLSPWRSQGDQAGAWMPSAVIAAI